MEKEKILEQTSKKKAVVGEMEKEKISKSALISLLVTGAAAVVFVIVEGVLGHFSGVYAIAAICFLWASVFYTLQYFLAKRPWQVLIGSILSGLASILYIVRYILSACGIWW